MTSLAPFIFGAYDNMQYKEKRLAVAKKKSF